MSENKSYKLIAIIAILVGAVGVAIGYSAFSSNLIINSSAEVTPDANLFSVKFSSSDQSVQTNAITPTLSPQNVTGFSGTNATISNSGDPTISNLKATFTEPGQSVTYSFNSFNDGEYIAYLNSITFTGSKTCTAKNTTTQSLVDAACNGISLSITVGESTKTVTTTETVSSISSHSLATNTAEPVSVTITYASGSGIADGDFDVTLPSITLKYDSVD